MAPKPKPANNLDLQQLKDEIMKEIDLAKQVNSKEVKAAEAELRTQITNMSTTTIENATEGDRKTLKEAEAFAEKTINKSSQVQAERLEEAEKKTRRLEDELKAKIKNEIEAVREILKKSVKDLKDDMTAYVNGKAVEAHNGRMQLQQDVDTRQTKDEADLMKRTILKTIDDTKASLQMQTKRIEDNVKQQDAEKSKQLGELFTRMQKTEDEMGELPDKINRETERRLKEFEETVNYRLNQVSADQTKLLRRTDEIENVHTRRVEWVIENVSRKLAPWTKQKGRWQTSWFSPKFDAAGVRDLQLELQIGRAGEDEKGGPDCSLFLWAGKGTCAVYRLFVGHKARTFEKTFNGRIPHGTEHFCFLREVMQADKDILKVGVELLEVKRDIEIQTSGELAQGASRPLKAMGDMIIKNRPIDNAKDTGEPQPDDNPEGKLRFCRHTNNRMFELVQSQVDNMMARLVKRVEWKIEQASLLRDLFPGNMPLCSPKFPAAGIENMQLLFYPSGYSGSTEGFCSLFLCCPAGSTLKCSLFAGQQRREIAHTYEVQSAYGRTNFCRLEGCVDITDDSITCSLEIHEAHQQVTNRTEHQGVSDTGTGDGDATRVVESVIKLQRSLVDNKRAGLETVKQLPSLWTSKPLADIERPADGYHSFSELRSTARKGGVPPWMSQSAPTLFSSGELSPTAKIETFGGKYRNPKEGALLSQSLSDWPSRSYTGSDVPKLPRNLR